MRTPALADTSPGVADWIGVDMGERTCSIDGCSAAHEARGWCRMHYARWKRNGDPLALVVRPQVCGVDGCDEAFKAKGFCQVHYSRWRDHGDPLVLLKKRHGRTLQDRLDVDVDRSAGSDACWPYTGTIMAMGYGQMSHGRKGSRPYAHRVAYEAAFGPVPEGLEVDHVCHNGTACPGGPACPHRRCCNPEHMEAVPHLVNVMRGEWFIAVKTRQTHCLRNHPFSGENLAFDSRGRRRCRTCIRAKSDRFSESKRPGP